MEKVVSTNADAKLRSMKKLEIAKNDCKEETADNKSTAIIDQFKNYAILMKQSQDKYERLFKISRDIVIESKRIIFLLHTIDGKSNRETVLEEANRRLNLVIDKSFNAIKEELKNEDSYRYCRAISGGNQEFIEALTLYEYMKDGSIKGLESCQSLPFVPNSDYILGLADLTGELMRQAVSSIGVKSVAKYCNFMRELYTAMLGLPQMHDLPSKLEVMDVSVCKVERALYKIHIMESLGGNQPLAFENDEEERGV